MEFDLQRFAEDTEPESPPPTESQTVSREEYDRLKAQLAEVQKQQPLFKITPEILTKINQAIQEEAMALTGFSQDDADSLDWADDDAPRLAQWNQAKSIDKLPCLKRFVKGTLLSNNSSRRRRIIWRQPGFTTSSRRGDSRACW